VFVLALAQRAEARSEYNEDDDATPAMAADEAIHEEVVRGLATRGRNKMSGTFRAAVFGANDGLVSNLALLLGVAAAGAERHALMVTGLAGLFAGALSMAVGEYSSVASQRDLLRRQIVLESRELAEAPEEEEAELVQLLQDKGLSSDQADQTARQIMQNPESALDTLVRMELGLDPADLGSPVRAAISSFLTFAVGAALPLAPMLLLPRPTASYVAATLGAVVLGAVGAFLGFLSGGNPWRAAARMVVLAALAAGVTVGVGRLVGGGL
jgi:VIT1/CCC1 family predicted Fe2+/Mn2+ transporter